MTDTQIHIFNILINQLNLAIATIRRGSSYAARSEIEIIKKQINNRFRLEHYGYKVYSQNDEDGIIEEIFERLEITNGSFLEIGIENGLECNTLLLLHKGWKGGWLEGNTDQQQHIKEKFDSV